MSPPRPAPRPTTERATRLEQVREELGYDSLRQFWAELTEHAKPFEVSYEAVRNYHYDRDAPVEYYLAVSRVFSVNVVWLLTGGGPRWSGDAGAVGEGQLDPVDQKVAEALEPIVEGLRPDAATMFSHTYMQLLRAARVDLSRAPQTMLEAIGRNLWNVSQVIWGLLKNPSSGEDPRMSEAHHIAAMLAIRTAIADDYSPAEAEDVFKRLSRASKALGTLLEPREEVEEGGE